MEIWKDIPGYEGHYQISSIGRVSSLKRKKVKILKPDLDRYGYHAYRLYGKNRSRVSKKWLEHRLVALAFIGKSELTVNHKNGNKIDNRPENLEYLSFSENSKHGHKLGLMINGYKNRKTPLTDSEKMQIRALRGLKRPTEISKQFKVSYQTIYNVWGKCEFRVDVGQPATLRRFFREP